MTMIYFIKYTVISQEPLWYDENCFQEIKAALKSKAWTTNPFYPYVNRLRELT